MVNVITLERRLPNIPSMLSPGSTAIVIWDMLERSLRPRGRSLGGFRVILSSGPSKRASSFACLVAHHFLLGVSIGAIDQEPLEQRASGPGGGGRDKKIKVVHIIVASAVVAVSFILCS